MIEDSKDDTRNLKNYETVEQVLEKEEEEEQKKNRGEEIKDQTKPYS